MTTYHAFISYSHAADGKLAPALQRAFHTFARPVFKIRALRVFRDKESLSANPALWPAIESALGASEYFVLLGSPEAARSPWVAREVQWWLANRSVMKQLVVVTDGDIVWDTGKRDFDWDRTTALPRILAGRFSDEPLWVDLRWAKTADDLSLQHSQFRAAVLDLAAPLHGKPKEELDSEDVRQHRKLTRLRRSAVAGLTALTIAVGVVAVYAFWQRNEAVQQRDRALSRQVSAQALRVLDTALDTSLLLAVEASRRADTFEAKNALLSALVRAPFLGSFLPGHRAHVTAATFSADGKVLASGDSDDGFVLFWDVERGEALGMPIVGHSQGVTRLAFSPDGRWLASAGRDRVVRIWDVAARRPSGSPLQGHGHSVAALAFSSDGRTLASGDDGGSVMLWDVDARKSVGPPLTGTQGAVTALAFDGTGSALASGDGGGTVVVWDLRTPERAGTAFFKGRFFVRTVGFAADGHAVAAGLSAGNVIHWDVGRTPPRVHPLSSGGQSAVTALDTRAAAVASSGKSLAVAVPSGDVIVADLVTSGDRQPLVAKATLKNPRPRSGILAVALSEDGRKVASGYRGGTLVVWDVTEPSPLARPLRGGHRQEVTAVAFAPRGTMLVSGSLDRTLILWDAATLAPLGPPLDGHTGSVASVAFSPNGAWMTSGDDDGTVLFWDVAARRARGEPLRAHRNLRVSGVAVSPDGTLLAVASGGQRVLWDVESRQPLTLPLEGRQSGVASAAFSLDGTMLALGGVDGSLMLWNVAKRQWLAGPVMAHDGPVNAVAFRPDGTAVASVGRDARLKLWAVTSGRALAPAVVLDPIDRDRMQSVGGALLFSPDGRTMVSGGNGRIVLWDVPSRQPLDSVLYASGDVARTRLAIAPDGSPLAASNGDGIVLWDIALSAWQRHACRFANRDLTEDEWNKFVGAELPHRRTCGALRDGVAVAAG